MKASVITLRRRAPRRADGGNVADEGKQTTQQPTDFRREIRMVATMDDGRRPTTELLEGRRRRNTGLFYSRQLHDR